MGYDVFGSYRAVHEVYGFLDDGHTETAAVFRTTSGLIGPVKGFEQMAE